MIIKHRKIFYAISGVLVILSLLAIVVWGLKPGTDFTGGSLLEVEYKGTRPEVSFVQNSLSSLTIGNVAIQPTGDKGFILRFKNVTEEEHQLVLSTLSAGKPTDLPVGEFLTQKRFDSIGPVIGKELTRRAWMAIVLVSVVIIIFIAIAFRKVSKPVSSWVYGAAAVLALIHDVTIPAGFFAVLGHFKGVEVDILFVSALLTILGFSVQDTIVVFDRTRENLKKGGGKLFEETVNTSLMQVAGRSLKTSLTIIFVLLSLLFFGGETTKYFALTLTLGMIFGTYSSIFLASPILVSWHKWKNNRK
ncbi:MAG: protein translocase subunit SecF [bacterium]|nr:protein translocase subunit SecF [bacterium]